MMRLASPLAPLLVLVAAFVSRSAAASLEEDGRAGEPGEVVEDAPQVAEPTSAVVEEEPQVDTTAPKSDEEAPYPVEAAPRTDDTPSPTPHPAAAAASPLPSPTPQVRESGARIDEPSPRPEPSAERRPETQGAAPTSKTSPQEASPPPEGFGFGGVPALNYTADNGFGFGAVTTAYFYDRTTRPYRAALTLQIFISSKLVQDHNVVLDWLRAGDVPLRVWARLGYLQSLTQNYCGLGGAVTCDPAVASAAGLERGLADDALEAFARRYYLRRFISPHAALQLRYAVVEKPTRFELTGAWRGVGLIPGTWDDEDGDGSPDQYPYGGSLYAKDHPDGEPGFGSVLQVGFMVDSRDNEPAPTSGLWLEGSVRTSSALIGSSWNWSGANLTLRSYTNLDPVRKIVFANRLVLDGVVGDPPVQELARAGGSNDYYLYGGADAGRGIRVQRYLGKLRAFDQAEVRWRFFDTELLEQRFGFTAVAFVDMGVVGEEVGAPGQTEVLPAGGGALRISWNENFIIRLDVGLSPIEQYAPAVYLLIGNPF